MGGALCTAQPGDIVKDEFSPDESDFPGGLRNYAVPQRRFNTLLEAFQYCDPRGTGNITDRERFAEVAEELANDKGDVETVWGHLDLDGNGAVNFPEFVEWAERVHVPLEIGLPPSAEGQDGVTLPHGWSGSKDDRSWNQRIAVTDTEELMELQDLMNASYKKVWTRDRKATGVNKVPESYELIRADRNENFADWKGYYMKRHLIAHNCSKQRDFEKRPALTSKVPAFKERMRLREYCNEWMLFHGTSHEAAETISGGDFTMKLAGSATGTLYGRGTYFAESITKADEYAKKSPEDDCCCALVCRVVGGRVRYNDEEKPDPNDLQNSVTVRGEYDSVLGDREKCRNTFKEYVIFDADQVYVDYVLYYKRIY